MTDPDLLTQRLQRALDSMDSVSREVFLAHRLDGLNYCEIAARRDLTLVEVERQMAHAILHLDRALRAMEREAGP